MTLNKIIGTTARYHDYLGLPLFFTDKEFSIAFHKMFSELNARPESYDLNLKDMQSKHLLDAYSALALPEDRVKYQRQIIEDTLGPVKGPAVDELLYRASENIGNLLHNSGTESFPTGPAYFNLNKFFDSGELAMACSAKLKELFSTTPFPQGELFHALLHYDILSDRDIARVYDTEMGF